jgi:hypothetical protein
MIWGRMWGRDMGERCEALRRYTYRRDRGGSELVLTRVCELCELEGNWGNTDAGRLR